MRLTSRLMVEGARPSWRAIARNECLTLSPLDISSRSLRLRARRVARPIRRANAARRRDHRKDRRRLTVKPTPNRTHRLSALPAIPDLSPLSGRIVNPTTILHSEHSILAQRSECCVHPLRPPDIAVKQMALARAAPGSVCGHREQRAHDRGEVVKLDFWR